jgi:hypothetical protein
VLDVSLFDSLFDSLLPAEPWSLVEDDAELDVELFSAATAFFRDSDG